MNREDGNKVITTINNCFLNTDAYEKHRILKIRKCEVKDEDGVEILIVPSKVNKEIMKLPVLYSEDMFETIFGIHCQRSHVGINETKYQVSTNFACVPVAIINYFVNECPVC